MKKRKKKIKRKQIKMDNTVRAIMEAYFSKSETILEGPSEKTWNQNGFSVSLAYEYMKYFVALASSKEKFDWLIHFENETDPKIPFTNKEKDILYKALAANIKSGEIVTSEGGVTPGGISGMKNLEKYGFKIIGKHSGKSLYWASKRMLDDEKFEKWLSEPSHRNDFKIINKNKPISRDNVKPVLPILKKI